MEERSGIRAHACRLENRNAASLTGVREVVSFDENQVVMDTDMGLLTIKGKDRLLLQSISVGAVLMMVYDLIRLFRSLVPHRSLAVGLEDFCYWIWAGFFTFLFLYRENDGALRFYIIGSIFVSMLFYDRIISRNLQKLLKLILRCIRMKLHR